MALMFQIKFSNCDTMECALEDCLGCHQGAEAAVTNFYETLRFEVGDMVGITTATHGWIGSELTSGKNFTGEEGTDVPWKEEITEVSKNQTYNLISVHGSEKDVYCGSRRLLLEGYVVEYARQIGNAACRGDP